MYADIETVWDEGVDGEMTLVSVPGAIIAPHEIKKGAWAIVVRRNRSGSVTATAVIIQHLPEWQYGSYTFRVTSRREYFGKDAAAVWAAVPKDIRRIVEAYGG